MHRAILAARRIGSNGGTRYRNSSRLAVLAAAGVGLENRDRCETSKAQPTATLTSSLSSIYVDAEKNLPSAIENAVIALRETSPQGSVEQAPLITPKPAASAFSHPDQAGLGASGEASARMQGFPVFRASEVAKHKDVASGVWVTFKDGVFDVTEFVQLHPGGHARLLLAAGGPLEPFWALYQQHAKDYVLELLERYRIGVLHPDDVASVAGAAPGVDGAGTVKDPYADEPMRHPALQVRSPKPYNAEPPGPLLVDAYITPTPMMFVRNHMPVPDIKESEYVLTIEIPGHEALKLTLADLKSKFPKVEVVAALCCAGNRRADMSASRQARGLAWQTGAIANCTWAGVRLNDVLRAVGIDVDAAARDGIIQGPDGQLAHVQFEGLDSDKVSGTAYGASIPLDMACDNRATVLLAYEMNGAPLTRDHGFPVRAVTPGLVGARQVKWLGKIVASKEESASIWQRKDYKAFPPWQDWDNTVWDSMPAIQDMPVSSAIADPPPGPFSLAPGQRSIPVRGWAWSGGGRAVVRVELTADGGRTWVPATITAAPVDQSPSHMRSYGWTLWRADVPVPPPSSGPTAVSVSVRAMDVACNTQSSSPVHVWNWRGLANNSWHSVQLALQPHSDQQ